MNEHKHIIVINGRRYNAKTGENLSHPTKATTTSRPAHHVPAPKPAAATHASTTRKPAPKTDRKPGSQVKPHAPKPSRTLMRHAVKKPAGGPKHRIRVQARLDSQLTQPVITVSGRVQLKRPNARQAQHRIVKGRLITHFSPNLFTTVTHATVVAARPVPASRPAPSPAPAVKVVPARPSRKPRTTAELLEYAMLYADSPPDREEPVRRKRSFRRSKRHARVGAHA